MPVYYIDIPVSKLKVDLLNRKLNKSHLSSMLSVVQKSGIKHPIILRDKGTDFECLLGNTRIQVALMLKIPTISCLLITNRYYKDLKRVESFEDFISQTKLTDYDIQRGLLKAIL